MECIPVEVNNENLTLIKISLGVEFTNEVRDFVGKN